MAIVIIPEKICPNCGSTRWSVFKKKDWRSEKIYKTLKYYTQYTCASTSETGCSKLKRKKYYIAKPRIKVSEEYARKRVADYQKNNKHKWISQSKKVHAVRCRDYYKNNPKYKKRIKDFEKKSIEIMTNSYIKKIICHHDSSLSRKDIPQDLIELKRKQLLLFRQIRNHENKEKNSNHQ